jgi:hypothetical protein
VWIGRKDVEVRNGVKVNSLGSCPVDQGSIPCSAKRIHGRRKEAGPVVPEQYATGTGRIVDLGRRTKAGARMTRGDLWGRCVWGVGKDGKGRYALYRTEKERQPDDDFASSEIDWSRSGHDWIGGSRSGNWNGVWSLHHWNVAEPVKGSQDVPICHYGICVDGSDCVVRIDDGVFDFVYVLRTDRSAGRPVDFGVCRGLSGCRGRRRSASVGVGKGIVDTRAPAMRGPRCRERYIVFGSGYSVAW